MSLLGDAEQMLQSPALLVGHRATVGIENGCLVSVSYFYISAVKKLQKDEWQVAMYFLQALLISPMARYALPSGTPDLIEEGPGGLRSEPLRVSLPVGVRVAGREFGWIRD